MKNFFSGLLGLLIVAGMIFGALTFKRSDFYDHRVQDSEYMFADLGQKFDVLKYNISVTFGQYPRKLSSAEKLRIEGELRQMIKPFQSFKPHDWNKFWKFVYSPKKSGFFQMKRWRTKKEMEMFFAGKFPDPFGMYEQKQWQAFWGILEQDKGFKHVVYSDTATEEDMMLVEKKKAVYFKTPEPVRRGLFYSPEDIEGGA